MSPRALEHRTSTTGKNLATALAEKVEEAIDGFPGAVDDEKAAIARLAAGHLIDRAKRWEKKK